ncbi:MAG TPA: hypothetical protein VNV37_00745 [Solirubrobacteraceae bacterium]|nr:hypothetical protein [Solirubrobacteraceae bacterium]
MSARAFRPWALALATVIPLTLAYLIARPPSGDLAAATYRGEVFARAGFTLWDNGWYGGHYLPGYSVLAPALGALLGERLLLGLSTIAAACLFGAIAQRLFAPGAARVAAVTFAVGACVTMLSGRVAFTLGLAVGLLAVLQLARGRAAAAVALAPLTSLASPVAGAFLALVGVTDALAGRPRRGLALAAAALAPIALFTLAFPEGGYEPFAPSVFWPGLAGVALIALALPRLDTALPTPTVRALTIGAWLYALVLIGAFALQTPVGSNAARLGELFAAPLVAGVLWERCARADTEARSAGAAAARGGPGHPLLLLALAPVLLYWQLETPINDFAALAGDPSVNASYYAPLLRELQRRARGALLRVEVPLTGAHWESAYLPEHGSIMLARGWERQLDTRYGALFYEGGPLAEGSPSAEAGRHAPAARIPVSTSGAGAAAAYRAWLGENGVAYVALPDARLDFAGAAEGRLIARGLPYLREVWRARHWRLYAVTGATALAQPPARLLAVGVDSFTLAAPRSGSYTVRVRYTPYWALQRGSGCVRRAAGGWTVVQARGAGTMRVGIDFSPARIFDDGARCT